MTPGVSRPVTWGITPGVLTRPSEMVYEREENLLFKRGLLRDMNPTQRTDFSASVITNSESQLHFKGFKF